MELDRCSYVILATLRSRNAINKIQGLTIYEIADVERSSKHNTLHKKVKQLQKYGYINEGIKAGKCKTYFASELGLKVLPIQKED